MRLSIIDWSDNNVPTDRASYRHDVLRQSAACCLLLLVMMMSFFVLKRCNIWMKI